MQKKKNNFIIKLIFYVDDLLNKWKTFITKPVILKISSLFIL